MTKTIYLSHGEKGGVGKSRVAMVLVDYLMKIGHPVALVEGDKSGIDVGQRYSGLVETGYINLNRPDAMEEAFSSLGRWFEDHARDKNVVVNLPGQASDTLDQFAALLGNVAEMLGYDLSVFYSVGPLDLHTGNLQNSIQTGLMSASEVTRQIVVMSEHGGPVIGYHWFGSKAREKFLGAGGKEGIMPKLKPDHLEKMVRELSGGYSAMLDRNSPIKIADRALLFSWLKAAHEVVALGVTHE